MRLDQVTADLDVVHRRGDAATEVADVTHDSRAVIAGALFCCVPGGRADGHDFAADAVGRGAVALLCERPLALHVGEVEVAEVEVADVRKAMGHAAASFHGHPSRAMRVVGVTGTNGKTTTVHLLGSILGAHGWPTEVIGTLTGQRTTPEATELQARLASMRDTGAAAVAMEVSSHALALHRVEGTSFAVAVFTNLSRDHLDFHRSMDDYFRAKATLFDPQRAERAVVNLDDPHGRRLHREARLPTVGYSFDDALDLEADVTGTAFTWEGVRMRVPVGGRFNVGNALAAATAARELGVAPATVAEGLDRAGPVAGRFQPVDAGQPFAVLVDYAHTPDGLEQVLRSARALVGDGRLLLVFGCGGDRDHSKRAEMGRAAATWADVAVLTSDNPRNEDPEAIIEEVRAGMAAAQPVVEPDRRAAIALALGRAGADDLVVVAGKGHETTQVTGARTVAFDDRQVVRDELARLGYGDPSGKRA